MGGGSAGRISIKTCMPSLIANNVTPTSAMEAATSDSASVLVGNHVGLCINVLVSDVDSNTDIGEGRSHAVLLNASGNQHYAICPCSVNFSVRIHLKRNTSFEQAMRAVLSLVHKFVHKNNGAGWNAVYRCANIMVQLQSWWLHATFPKVSGPKRAIAE